MALAWRSYASVRLGNMHPWILTWMLPSMFAGVPGAGAGAEDAAWLASLEMEYCKVLQIPITAGGADIRKCFDAILRQRVYLQLWIGGRLRGVTTAYRNLMEAMMVYNTVASGLARPHKFVASHRDAPFP